MKKLIAFTLSLLLLCAAFGAPAEGFPFATFGEAQINNLNSRTVYSFTSAESGTGSDTAVINARFGVSNPLVFLVPGGEEDGDYALQRELVEKLQSIRKEDGTAAVSSVSAMVTTGETALEYYTPQDVADLTGQPLTAVQLFFLLHGFGDSVRADRLLESAASLAEGN